MLLRSFRVEKFRNIIDSQLIEAQNDVTCLVGKNESGKTTLLEALYRINPAYATPFDLEAEYPRWLLIQDRKSGVAAEAVPILAVFELEEDDIAIVEELVGPEVLAEPFITVGLKYNGDPVVSLQLDETRAVTNLLARVPLQDVTRLEVENCPDLLILQQAMEGQREKANKGPPEPGFAWVNPEELDALQVEITRILRGCSSLWHAIVALLRQRLPTFFYFDDYSTLPGRINLSELRSAQARPPLLSFWMCVSRISVTDSPTTSVSARPDFSGSFPFSRPSVSSKTLIAAWSFSLTSRASPCMQRHRRTSCAS